MAWVPGMTFRMGSDEHYPEEAPAHPVTVSGFWIDRREVTNSQFGAFVDGHRLQNARRAPARPGGLPWRAGGEPPAWLTGLHPHRRTRRPPPPLTLVGLDPGSLLATPRGAELDARGTRGSPSRARRLRGRRAIRGMGWKDAADRGPMGAGRHAAVWTVPPSPGVEDAEQHLGTRYGQLLAWRLSLAGRPGLRDHSPRGLLSRQRIRALRYGRQRLGVDIRLVSPRRIPSRGTIAAACPSTRSAARSRAASTRPSRSSRFPAG